MEAAADVIAHAAQRHRAQRVRSHEERRLRRDTARDAPRVLAQQEQQLGRPRKLRRVAEPAVAPIERHAGTARPRRRARRRRPLSHSARDLPSVPVTDFSRSSSSAAASSTFAAVLAPHAGELARADRRNPDGPSATSAESTCRRRTASAPASGTRSSASRPIRSSPARTTCRRGRRRAVPRDRP